VDFNDAEIEFMLHGTSACEQTEKIYTQQFRENPTRGDYKPLDIFIAFKYQKLSE
jgi:hypothetical protein